jgi:methyl-accepting chemotaxis protein
MKSFKNWKIGTKIMSISVFTIVVVIAGMLFYVIPLMESKLMHEKENALKGGVDVIDTLLASYNDRAKSGEMKVEEAQRRAITNIRVLRYQGNEYFGLIDVNSKGIMHPFKPELEGGNDVSGQKDQ